MLHRLVQFFALDPDLCSGEDLSSCYREMRPHAAMCSSIAFIASDMDVGHYRSAETVAGFGLNDVLDGTTTEEDDALGFMDEY